MESSHAAESGMRSIPVIDIFAGPGGLSEGFSRYGERDWNSVLSPELTPQAHASRPSSVKFKVALSIEMDEFAHRTLRLRAFVRLLKESGNESDYYESLPSGEAGLEALFAKHASAFKAADAHAWRAQLGKVQSEEVDARIQKALAGAEDWVLIGGPPCQAYSLAGRSRNLGKTDYVPEEDHRHFLYREYLRIVATHQPSVFVMENVKGILSSQVHGGFIFKKILDDLRAPSRATNKALKYTLFAVGSDSHAAEQSDLFRSPKDSDFIVRAEDHGIPQSRHRVIIIGIRSDHQGVVSTLKRRRPVSLSRVLKAPPVHAGVSDESTPWLDVVRRARTDCWIDHVEPGVRSSIRATLAELRKPRRKRGAEHIEGRDWDSGYASEWFSFPGLLGFLNHSTRSHMATDLHRYLFAAAWAQQHEASPSLCDFPHELLPKHRNARAAAVGKAGFADRFRVQVSTRPSTTITSHISKDGHYYIHPAVEQVRSLTVREAARLQTFPDDYFFCGPRTEQYRQVGNAVPSLLAVQIAGAIATAF